MGPSLPVALQACTLVSDRQDILMLGGFKLEDPSNMASIKYVRTIYRLSPGGKEWKQEKTELKRQRAYFPYQGPPRGIERVESQETLIRVS